MVKVSQGASWVRVTVGVPVGVRASGDSGTTQRRDGDPTAFSSLFHDNQRLPSASVNTWGSIEPPSSLWQTGADRSSSTNGPSGRADVAREMHWRPDARSLA